MKKICNVVTGVVRPDSKRVLNNIKETIKVLSNYDCDHYVLTYKSHDATELKSMIEDENLDLDFYMIDPIQNPVGGFDGKNYMMFRCIELLLQNIPNFYSYDVAIRHRIDCELKKINLPNDIADGCYYSPLTPWGLIFDNIGLAKPSVFESIFKTDEVNFNFNDPHQVLNNILNTLNIELMPFNFKDALYQSNDEFVLGIPQWSKGNRIFEYDEKWISGF
jgi:hypothetical protein